MDLYPGEMICLYLFIVQWLVTGELRLMATSHSPVHSKHPQTKWVCLKIGYIPNEIAI